MAKEPHYGYWYSPNWYSSEDGWWLRLAMSAIMVICLAYGFNAMRGNSIDKRIADLESREKRSVRHLREKKGE